MSEPAVFHLVAKPHPFRADVVRADVEVGCTLFDMGAGPTTWAWVNGERADDLNARPADGDHVLLLAVPAGGDGGKQVLFLAASVALAVATAGASAAATGAYAAAAGVATTSTSALTVGAAAGALTGIVGGLVLNQLIPPPQLDSQPAFKPFDSITRTSNGITPYQAVPKLYGTFRVYPRYASQPVPVANGAQQDFLGLYCAGYRNIVIDPATFKLGETPLANFVDTEVRVRDYDTDEDIENFFPITAVVDNNPADLKEAPSSFTRTTPTNTKAAVIDFGGGPIGFFGDEDKDELGLGFRVEYRPFGSTGAYTTLQPTFVAGDGGAVTNFPLNLNLDGTNVLVPGGSETQTFGPAAFLKGNPRDPRLYTVSVRVEFPSANQWEVRVTRLPAARYIRAGLSGLFVYLLYYNDSQKVKQESNLLRIRYERDQSIGYELDSRFAYVALKLKASDQLSGAVDDFNFIATSVVEKWNGSAWVMGASNNPAWHYRDILLGTANERPVEPSRLDEATLIAWGQSCDTETPPREFNGEFNARTTVFEALRAVAAAGRAAFSIRDGKYSVVRDLPGLTPVQMFTPLNMWDFSGDRAFSRLPHALKIKYQDRANGYQEAERVVYDDGYSIDGSAPGTVTATIFEQLALFGCTDAAQAYKDGRYNIAVGRLRPETFSWNAAIENLVCQRGDVVRLQHDAMLTGLGAGRIVSISGGTITLDQVLPVGAGAHAVRVRKDDGTTALVNIANAPGETNTFSLSGGVPAGVQLGDLVALGTSGAITLDVLVTEIEPGPDFTARLTGVPYSSPGVHAPIDEIIPDYDPGITPQPVAPAAPYILNIDSSREVGVTNSDGSFVPRIFVSYIFPDTGLLVAFADAQFKPTGTETWLDEPRRQNSGSAYIPVFDTTATYDLRLRGISADGVPGPWTEVYAYTLESASLVDTPALTLLEQRNNPATPNGDQSTIVATVTPVADPEYSHALVEYRKLNDTTWTLIGPTDAANQQRLVVTADGTTYEFRARAVNVNAVAAQFGTVESIVVSTANGAVPGIDPDADAPTLDGLNVANLRLQGQAVGVSNFGGQHLRIQWDAVVPPAGQTLRDYRVQIVDSASGTTLRYEYVTAASWVYFYADHQQDALRAGLAGPVRQLSVRVIARSAQGFRSAALAARVFSNPAPALPGDFTRTVDTNTLILRFTRPADDDYVKAVVYLSTVNGFTPGSGNVAYEGAETNPITIPGLGYGTTYYTRVLLFDSFGPGTISAQFTDITGDLPGTDTIPPTVPGTPSLSSAVQSATLSVFSRLDATWAPSTDASGALFYEYEYWTTDASKKEVARTSLAEAHVFPAQPGVTYSFRVRALDYSGNASAWTSTVTHTVAGDLVAPANVTDATATPGLDKIVLEYVQPADADFLSVLIYRGTSDGFTANAGSQIGEFRGTVFVDSEVVAGTSYFYKFATRDVAGNLSAPSAAIGPAVPLQITSGNVGQYVAPGAVISDRIADAAISTAKFAAGLRPVEIVDTLPTSGNVTGRTVFLTTDSKLYRFNGSTFVATVPTADLTGQITTTQITDNAITTGKIAANAVTAAQIAANTITAGQIAADTITAGQIATGTITASEIAANSITTNKLVVGDFTNLLENADYELGNVGWVNYSGNAWSIVQSGQANRGQWHAQISSSGTHYWENLYHVSVEPGATLYAAVRVKFAPGSSGSGTYVAFDWYDSTGAYNGSANGVAVSPSNTNYVVASVTATAPAVASKARLSVVSNGLSGVCYVDDAQMHRVSGSALIADAAIINAKIANATITNAKIADATITNAKIANLDAGKITTGFLAAGRIQAATITADKLAVTQLSAISADLGTISAGTITGAIIRTASSGQRVELNSVDGIRTLNSSDVVTAAFNPAGSGFIGSVGGLNWNSAGSVTFTGSITATSTLTMTTGAIQAGKTSYASTTSGYWLGYDGGLPKFHVGNSTDRLMWDGTSLIANNIKTAVSGQRVVMSAGNEMEFYDPEGSEAVTVGIATAESDSVYLLAGLPHAGAAVGTSAQQARIGVAAYSGTSTALVARSASGSAIRATSASRYALDASTSAPNFEAVRAANLADGGTGLRATGGQGGIGVLAQGNYAGAFTAQSPSSGGHVLLSVLTAAAPTHTALAGTLYFGGALNTNTVGDVFLQQRNNGTGSGNDWVNIS